MLTQQTNLDSISCRQVLYPHRLFIVNLQMDFIQINSQLNGKKQELIHKNENYKLLHTLHL